MDRRPRDQLTLYSTCLAEIIPLDNGTRLIDAFVNSLDLESYGFTMHAYEDGRPRYHSSELLKIFIYGYMHRIRSSIKLERAVQII